jgi:predicted ATP-binding protein involved in virulence
MQLKRFKATAVHGFLNFDISFNEDVTFLTGINGSGKTSVVQSIIALISPSLSTLANLLFDRMEVEITHDDCDLSISATRTNNSVTLSTSRTDESFTIPPYIPAPDEPSYRSADGETQFYLDLTTTRSPHAVIELINSLPTPMFLDLDRRARFQTETEQRRVALPRGARRARNIFNISLTGSLLHATALAEGRYRELVDQI